LADQSARDGEAFRTRFPNLLILDPAGFVSLHRPESREPPAHAPDA
jgi:hypothetical protein